MLGIRFSGLARKLPTLLLSDGVCVTSGQYHAVGEAQCTVVVMDCEFRKYVPLGLGARSQSAASVSMYFDSCAGKIRN